ncbi:protein MPODD, putative [Plasmodium vinckei lentum]|uniref:Protein MPODD, putative n=1 Tax=Plasmodium vinckei lentum TaxID=138297 RepID=A0A6V7SIU8_PLAVN|nr:protein MPODD, putative [Plasmodium vinckei lentum]
MFKLPFYSFNKNSLLVQCCKGAFTYYIPQNLAVISIFFYYQYRKNQLVTGKRVQIQNCDESINNFLKEKKLSKDDIEIQKKRNIYTVSLI